MLSDIDAAMQTPVRMEVMKEMFGKKCLNGAFGFFSLDVMGSGQWAGQFCVVGVVD